MEDRKSIMIVDDELGPRESLRMILKPSYEVYTADDGRAALELLKERPVDLMTLDLKMPGLSGMEVLEQIRESNEDVMVIIVTGYGTFRSAVEAIRFNVFDYISKPFNVQEILSVVKRCLEVRNTRLTIKNVFQEMAPLSKKGASEPCPADVIERIRRLLDNPDDFDMNRGDPGFLEFIRAVTNFLEKKDPQTIGHSQRVSYYTDFMAQKLGLSPPARTELQMACSLHDIGKACISSRFMKSEGKLSSTDWAILKRHPIKSVELIDPLELSPNVISTIRHHHERFDGTGYPDGLAGSEIPLGARVLSIGDVYDALTSKKPYREAMNAAEAEAEIEKCAGSYFDPDLTGMFLEVLKEEKSLHRQRDFHEKYEKEVS